MAVVWQTPISEVKNSGTSITIPIPTGWSPGDLLIAYVTKDDDNTCTPPAGWTELHDIAGGTAMNLWVGWRIAQEGDGELTWTWTGDSEDYYGVILRYTGHDPTNPIHASDCTGSAATASAIAPSVAFGDPIPLTVGSLVMQMFGADNPSKSFPYNFPAQLASRFNDEAGTIGGAGGDRECTDGWVNPTGYNDPGTEWDDETLAYDGSLSTWADRASIPPSTWSDYIEFTIDSISCKGVAFNVYSYQDKLNVSIDVFYADDWHNIYEGSFSSDTWTEKLIGSTQNVTGMRYKFYNTHTGSIVPQIYEVRFIATGETGTAIFGMSASEEWAAATVIIEALVAAAGGLSMKWNGVTLSKWNGVVIDKLNGIT